MNNHPMYAESKAIVGKCPKCNADLDHIIPERSGESYRWNEDKAVYETDDAQVSMVFKCGECGEIIGGWRSDGEEWGIIPETE